MASTRLLIQSVLLKKISNSRLVVRYLSGKIVSRLHERGLIKTYYPPVLDEIDKKFARKQTLYAGFDPTSDDLHLGNLLVIIALLHFARDGHQVICVIGDATAQIGDPSGREQERPDLEAKAINSNTEAIGLCLDNIFNNYHRYFAPKKTENPEEYDNDPIILNNGSWYKQKSVTYFLNKVGRNLRAGDMIRKQMVQERLNGPIGLSFAEFSYQAFQAYDWYYLFEKYNCQFQIGGNDQQGNIFTGHELIKNLIQKRAYGLTVPIVSDKEGIKYGKSQKKSPIWLNCQKLSPFNFYQFFITIVDDEVEKFLRLFTFYSLQEIDHIMQKFLRQKEGLHAQKKLAEALTLLIHGKNGLDSAKKSTAALFSNDIQLIGALSPSELESIFPNAPSVVLLKEPDSLNILDVAMKTKIFPSEMDAIKIIKAGGFYLNYKKEIEPGREISDDDILPNNLTLIRIGKHRFCLVKWL